MYMACIDDYDNIFGFGETIDQAQDNALKRLNKGKTSKYSLDEAQSFLVLCRRNRALYVTR